MGHSNNFSWVVFNKSYELLDALVENHGGFWRASSFKSWFHDGLGFAFLWFARLADPVICFDLAELVDLAPRAFVVEKNLFSVELLPYESVRILSTKCLLRECEQSGALLCRKVCSWLHLACLQTLPHRNSHLIVSALVFWLIIGVLHSFYSLTRRFYIVVFFSFEAKYQDRIFTFAFSDVLVADKCLSGDQCDCKWIVAATRYLYSYATQLVVLLLLLCVEVVRFVTA